jgi:tetratricopeptide (TPR) repeat protein
MKLGVRGTQIALISGAIILIVGLIFAPRLSSEDMPTAEINPTDLEISEAVALVENGENPMQGIMKLRAILEKDSTNVDVHWHLAQFSITSRQFENASFRFGKVLEYDNGEKYPDAYFWLAQTKVALGQRQEAVPLLEKYLTLETDTVILKGVENMLFELKQDSNNELN